MKTVPNPTLAAEFLGNWRPCGPWMLCAFHEDRTNDFRTFDSNSIDELSKWLMAQQAQERNIYFHVNPVRPDCGKASKGDVLRLEWLHVDVDPKKGADLKDEQARILAELQGSDVLPKPTVIVFSGGGYQSFWKLTEPIVVDGELAKVEDAEQYNVQIAKLLAADNCHNADRIMRLPGTINFPDAKKRKRGQKPVMADVVLADWDLTYDHNEFMKAPDLRTAGSRTGSKNQVKVEVSGNVPRIAAEVFSDEHGIFKDVSSRARVAIVLGRDPDQPLTGGNSRSDWLWYVACELVRHDFDDDTIYSIITDPDLGISEHVLKQGNAAAAHRSALRAIQGARENAIEPWLEQLNREYAAIESIGGKFRISCERFNEAKERVEVEFHLPDGFRAMWGNKFVEIPQFNKKGELMPQPLHVPVGKWWLAHPNRREYRGVVFHPNKDFPDSMNLWRGFAVAALPGDCSLYLDHIKNVLCKGSVAYYNYLLGWMANAVQNPANPGQTAIVLRGGQGTGKGTFGELFGKLFGTHYKYVSNPKHVTGQFNAMLQDAVLVFADECFAANDKAAESALKSLITESRLRVESKGIDNMEARNCVHLIMATNAQWAISADLDDRRFFVLEVDDSRKVDTEYFGAMRKQMDEGGYEALLHILMTYDLSDFDVFNCPKTGELRRQQDRSLNEAETFMLHMLEEGRLLSTHSGWRTRVLKEALVDYFRAEFPSFSARVSVNQRLGCSLARILGVMSETASSPETWTDSRGHVRPSSARPKIWVFPSLAECRKLWERNSGPRKWPDVGPNEDAEPSEDGGNAF